MLEIEILEPIEIEKAKNTVLRDGFVAIRDVLVGDQLDRIRKAADRVINDIIDSMKIVVKNLFISKYFFI